jgi:hypothetical protein
MQALQRTIFQHQFIGMQLHTRERQGVVLSMGARYSAIRRWLLVSINDIE